MKICVFLPTLSIGGAEKLHINLIQNWLADNHSVTIITLFKSFSEIDASSLLPARCNHLKFDLKNYKRSIFKIIKIFRSHKFQITLVPMWPLTCIAIMSWIIGGRPGKLFISEHTNISASHKIEIKSPLWIIKLSIKIFYRFATGIIAVSDGVKEDIQSLGGSKNYNIQVIYNPVARDSNNVNPDMIKRYSKELWSDEFKYKILAVGTLKQQKNFSLLIDSFENMDKKYLENSQLLILGDGPLKKELQVQINNFGLQSQVILCGNVVDPYPWFQSADLFVLSSQWEGFGNVLVEALESRTPVVSTNCNSGPSEILQDGRFGLLVPVNDKCALSSAMQKSLSTQHDLDSLQNRAKDFSISKISKEYLDFFLSSA
jgi:glycosyltransferase involved in cell wall biosynthesis